MPWPASSSRPGQARAFRGCTAGCSCWPAWPAAVQSKRSTAHSSQHLASREKQTPFSFPKEKFFYQVLAERIGILKKLFDQTRGRDHCLFIIGAVVVSTKCSEFTVIAEVRMVRLMLRWSRSVRLSALAATLTCPRRGRRCARSRRGSSPISFMCLQPPCSSRWMS